MANVVPSNGIIIVGQFYKRVAIYGSFLEQDIKEEPRALKIFNDLQILLKTEMRSGNRNKVVSLLWMGCDSDNGNLASSRTVIPEDPIGGWCFLLDIGFKHFLSIWPL